MIICEPKLKIYRGWEGSTRPTIAGVHGHHGAPTATDWVISRFQKMLHPLNPPVPGRQNSVPPESTVAHSEDLKKCPTRSTRRDLVGQMAILLAMAYQIPAGRAGRAFFQVLRKKCRTRLACRDLVDQMAILLAMAIWPTRSRRVERVGHFFKSSEKNAEPAWLAGIW